MNELHQFLVGIWCIVIGLIIGLYVVLDGFDLGIGILSCLARGEARRAAMMSALERAWDANQTWLLVLGVALFGAFPRLYDILLHGLYIPVLLMLAGLVLRAVAYEARKHAAGRVPWNLLFGIGSVLAALTQGFLLGALIGGLDIRHGLFIGGPWGWLTPFSALVAAGLCAGYALLGATYLLMKVGGPTPRRGVQRAQAAGWVMMGAAAAATVWTVVLHPPIAHEWFSPPSAFYMVPLATAALLAFGLLLRSLHRGAQRAPFVWSITLFVLSFLMLALSLFPYAIPRTVTAAEAAASSKTLVYMLTGIGILIPVMLIYNGYRYLVHRGRFDLPGNAPGDAGSHGGVSTAHTNARAKGEGSDAALQR